jgi:HK97 family phage prohead protease
MKKPKSKKQKRKSTKMELRAGKPETRSYKATRLETRKAADGSMQLVGTAIVFGSESQDLGGFVEICSYEAVQKSLNRNPDVFMLWQHDSAQPLARVKTGSLAVTLNRDGLDFVATLPNSPLGENAFEAVKGGTVDSVSFGFSIQPNGDEWIIEGEKVVRILRDINVGEISPVTWAAYLAPHVDVRSAPQAIRAKLKRTDDDDIDDPELEDEDDDSEEDRCECDCQNCQDGDCEDCTSTYCEDDDCNDCPNQTRAAHIALLKRRLR